MLFSNTADTAHSVRLKEVYDTIRYRAYPFDIYNSDPLPMGIATPQCPSALHGYPSDDCLS